MCVFPGEAEQDICLEKQLEHFEWQLRTLKQVLSANGNSERAELLKEHADEDVCTLVLSLLDKVSAVYTTWSVYWTCWDAFHCVNSNVTEYWGINYWLVLQCLMLIMLINKWNYYDFFSMPLQKYTHCMSYNFTVHFTCHCSNLELIHKKEVKKVC